MWKCPKCGREFKNIEQDHFCVKPNSIEEYIDAQPEDVRPLLQSIRETIREVTSEFTERLAGYKTSKGAIQLPLGKPIDYELINDIVRWRIKKVEG